MTDTGALVVAALLARAGMGTPARMREASWQDRVARPASALVRVALDRSLAEEVRAA
jgi:hypothetical protein